MSINLLDLVKDQVTGALTKQASSFLGEPESSVTIAMGSIMPVLLGSVVQKAATPSGEQGIMDMISNLDMDSLSNVSSLFGGGASSVNSLLSTGGVIVDVLLGNKSSNAIDTISNLSGLKSGSTSSLLKMAAPFLMSVICNQVNDKGLHYLNDMLMRQKNSIVNALPAGLGDVVGFADFTKDVPSVNIAATNSSSTGGGNNWMKWLLPLFLILGALYFLINKGCGKKAIEVTTDTITTVDSTAMKAAEMAGDAEDSLGSAMSKPYTKTLASGFALANAAENGIESQMITFIEDNVRPVDKTTWFNFDRLYFDTGKSTLQANSQEQLVNIAEILKAFPKVKIRVGGYTDNTGDGKNNLKLSTNRAFSVMGELTKLGIDKARLSAEGYGEQFPLGDNTTEEGRQMNRRIAVRVTEK